MASDIHAYRRLDAEPDEWLVYDEPHPCPYIPAQTARLPLRLPSRRLSRRELAARLAGGDRRQGVLLYRPTCAACRACEAIRIPVEAFELSKTQRRIHRRGEALLEVKIGLPRLTPEKVALYNRHKVERDLLVHGELLDAAAYEDFLVDSCADTFEITYRHQGRLVCVALVDRASDALSAVYCYYDPDQAKLSLGVYSILKQIQLCREWGLPYLYLGLYVGACRSMAYKSKYLPHERLIDGTWRRFE